MTGKRTGLVAVVAVLGGLACLLASCGGETGGSGKSQGVASVVPTTEALDHAEGRELYFRWCVPCHGDGGRGDGITASRLVPRPADLASTRVRDLGLDGVMSRVSDGAAAAGLAGVMPSWSSTLARYQIRAVAWYVLSQRVDVLSQRVDDRGEAVPQP